MIVVRCQRRARRAACHCDGCERATQKEPPRAHAQNVQASAEKAMKGSPHHMARRRSRDTFPFTPIPQANEVLRTSGTALLIGLCLEQQVRSEKAMSGPYVLQQRLGHLNAKKIAALPPATLDEVFRRPPALHRFPGMMAKRVRALCAVIDRDYCNDGTCVWSGAKTAAVAYSILRSLPGFGDY